MPIPLHVTGALRRRLLPHLKLLQQIGNAVPQLGLLRLAWLDTHDGTLVDEVHEFHSGAGTVAVTGNVARELGTERRLENVVSSLDFGEEETQDLLAAALELFCECLLLVVPSSQT